MLEIDVATEENFDESINKFVVVKSAKVRLEHSLVSLSKWESFWEEPFLGKAEKTSEQTLSYIRMMLLDEISPEVFRKLIEKHGSEINDYVSSKQTATTVPDVPGGTQNRETKTAELIYYWMISLGIPMECQYWHLNRLLMLIRVVNFKNEPKKTKMSVKDRRALNKARQRQYGTKG